MRGPLFFLKCVGKAALKAVAKAVPFGDVALDIAREVNDAWEKQHRLDDIQALVQASAKEIGSQVAAVVRELAANQPQPVRETLTAYLMQVPAAVQQSLRREADPTGTTVPRELSLNSAEDLVTLLPQRLPRFHPGDRPLPGVDWELVELLGTGGFGEVWKARNPLMDSVEPVALKFCLDPAAKDRLLRHEATILNQVMRQGKHSGIVGLMHTYLTADPPCLEYQYVEGGDLAGHIKSRKTPSPPLQVARIIQILAEVAGFAHQLDPPIVHRDLKPANILVQTTARGKTSFRITDFGIGGLVAQQSLKESKRSTETKQNLVECVRGAHTPLYASPQQKRGAEPDPRDDVHALGVIWYQMITGDLAKGPPTGRAWEQRLVERGMSQPLVDLLRSCMEEEPQDRPENGAALANRLGALLQEETAKKGQTIQQVNLDLDEEFVEVRDGGTPSPLSFKQVRPDAKKPSRRPDREDRFALEPIRSRPGRSEDAARSRGQRSGAAGMGRKRDLEEDDGERDWDEDDDRPRKKAKKGGGLLIWICSGAAVLLLAAFALTAFVWPGFLLSNDKPIAPVAVNPFPNKGGQPVADRFKEFKSDVGGFKALMPGIPKPQSRNAPGGGVLHAFLVEEANGAYMAAYADLVVPPGNTEDEIQQGLDLVRNGVVANQKGILIRDVKIKLAGKHPGREIEANLPKLKAVIRARFYIVGNRMYQAMAIGTAAWVNAPDANRFLDSFALSK